MAITKPAVRKADTPEWLRCKHAIRKLICHLGKDSLVYTQVVMAFEDDSSPKLAVFWESARRFFDEYKPKPAPEAEPKADMCD